MCVARLQKWELVLHGTETLPEVDMMTGVNVVPVAPVSASSAGASTSVDVQLNAIDVSEESWKPNPQVNIYYTTTRIILHSCVWFFYRRVLMRCIDYISSRCRRKTRAQVVSNQIAVHV